jgi:hydroxylamine reductase (hybrid-cluster protein)
VNNPNCVTALSVITSLYGFGDGFGVAGVVRFDVLSDLLPFGFAGICCEKQKAVNASPIDKQKNRFIIQYIENRKPR